MKLKVYLFCLLYLFCSLLNSTIWHIKQDGTGNFTTIQEGINASAHSDTVLVYPGRYFENINFNGKNIILASLELITGNESYISTTIIDGNQQGSCIILESNEFGTVVRGFSITNGLGNITYGDIDKLGGGILIKTAFQTVPINASLVNCNIFNNYAVYGGGIYIDNSDITLSGVSIYNNYACNGGGLNVLDESNIMFDPVNLCSIYNNFAGQALDILASDAVNDINVIVDTFTVQDQFDYFAIYQRSITSTGVIIIEPQNHYLERINHDLYVSSNGDDDNSGLNPDEPMKTIALALQKIESDSLNPKTVYVSAGIYSREFNDQIYPFSAKKYVSLFGENMNTTVLNNDYSETTYTMRHNKGYNSLENFTFRTLGQNSYFSIHAAHSDSILFKNIVIENCNVNHGSINIYRSYDIIFDNLTIQNNVSERCSGFWFDGGNVIIKNSVFDNNDSIGPDQWVANFYCHVDDYLELENCVFSNSDIPPFQYEEYYTIQISAQQNCFPDIKVSNCSFVNNSTINGSYIAYISSPGSVEVNNCTFTQNTSYICPLGIFGEIEFRNNILYNNESDYEYEINTGNYPTLPSILNVEYCDIEGGESAIYPGNPPNQAIINWLEGNINEDPLFLFSGNDPYQLTELSPCIDTGTPDTTGFFLPPWDLLHNYRVWDGDNNGTAIIDMGCYEFDADEYPVGITNDQLPVTDYQLTNYPNPFNPETKIVFDLPESGQVKLDIYNIKGQKVKTLFDCYLDHGRTETLWNGQDDNSKRVSSGIYFYKLKVKNSFSETKKMILMK
ncbi:MAG: T9SS type A sorting domain-containing protein [Candidatus Cloacimonadota bacterium]|nr:T9SS type A sorting domain-containing protein [Candidatus Cloacimonadota bacterium]